ncbi:glucose/quinate/shikimate family membrane-bound PQQ-dependent dehydrogenase [Acinetobacter pollinis]|uniref:glucose/quinate/shikimate family membrane-bound PQQ-dependent dehydrogenase n=1 Tax=Acinetobacter pollinis TaxID=2605270 RepID=UPI0018A2DA99|nr:glucose/quinate/shikimate family membrane-bound PQQ-dependent dehydrogenase [Acinetobacter pollinis]MBF7690223.1 glucose/quinate/shikimate family membrane-bound PQQ-dependent dehydrogenase [Acinetobacter pollinis]MBF7693507.1 glucose/quinate/shikimate family membrane-bound PQQ-dependent dehydrogenase [Acinetobacter pollinis]MBF7697693.1 glucose/quinate/shikimate family membrane-bound PQQ-dependent dehydrogenase [Acinetobacter pollinis]MBF7699507.1 glucose/quinate/shikimate family membrane-bo
MDQPSKSSGMRNFTAFILVVLGLVVLGGGAYLAVLGGSLYYIIAGLMLLASGILLFRRSIASYLVYAVLMLGTTIWGLWEVGSDFWALVPRLDILGVIGVWMLIPAVTNGIQQPKTPSRMTLAATLAFAIIVMVYSIFNDPQEINGEIKTSQPAQATTTPGVADSDWPAYGRTQDGQRYSPLTQINDKNVQNLKEAWVFRTGDLKTANDPGEITNQVTPIKIGNNMYMCTAHQFLIALDPKTGQEKWRFDPKLKSDVTFQHLTCRGVSYYDENNTQEFATSLKFKQSSSTQCPRKIILPVNDGRLVAVNADNGKPCTDFGHDGEVDLQKDMPFPYPGGYNPTSPPVVTGTTIIIGGATTDNFSTEEPSGVIRGYDVNTGKLLWVFDTGAQDPNAIPAPGQTFVNNSPNAWAPLSYDEKLDIVYIPTGVGTPDIWGGDRNDLKERYANSVLALNATTGKLVWHFQTTHHDLWDMDVPSQPTLADVKDKDGSVVPAVYVTTKTGSVFVLDRRDGRAIVPITERPVPQKTLIGPETKGERYSPTQPFSDLNLAPKDKLTDKDMWGATMLDQLYCRVYFKTLNYQGIYTPPSENGTLVFPGNLGVFEWGGISVNPDRQVALTNPLALPFVTRLIPQDPNRKIETKGAGTEHGVQPMYGVPYGVEISAFLSPLGLPCKQPGWGYVAAVDLKTNEIAWKKRIGTIRDSLPKLFQLPALKIGVPGLGGSISTAGNVMFVAGTQDNYIRAYNITNGDKLWEARLPAGGQATPLTYEIDGKQYVVIMAGGHGSFGTKMGDYLVAYALPDAK